MPCSYGLIPYSILNSLTAFLSSAFDSGAHSAFLLSVVGYYYRGYKVGIRARLAKAIRVRVGVSLRARIGSG